MSSTIGAAGTSADTAFDRSAHALSKVGHHYRAEDYYEIGREKVREYARAVHDYHPVHWHEDAAQEFGYEGLVAPLTFMAVVAIVTQRKLFETEVVGYDLSQVMQTDQTYEFHRPLLAGDKLTCDVYLHSFRQAFGGDLLTTKTVVLDQRGEAVMTSYTGLVARAVGGDDTIMEAVNRVLMHGLGPGEAPVTHPLGNTSAAVPTESAAVATATRGRHARPFGAVNVGDLLPERAVQLTTGDLVNYAGASGDPNPIHWSPDVAKLVGLENGVVAHGMLTMALGAGFVSSWLGDPGAVLDYAVRFTSPVYVTPEQPGEVVYTGKIKSIDPDTRIAVVAITATHNGKKIFGRATATVRLR